MSELMLHQAASERETGTQSELRLVTSILACRQIPPHQTGKKKIFFHKTPMFIKAENSNKSDLCSLKSKMSRGKSLKNQSGQDSLTMWTHIVVLTVSSIETTGDNEGERDSPAIPEICTSPKRLHLEGECAIKRETRDLRSENQRQEDQKFEEILRYSPFEASQDYRSPPSPPILQEKRKWHDSCFLQQLPISSSVCHPH